MATFDFLSTFNRTDQEDPLKVFRFQVEIANFTRFGFAKVTGLTAETEVTEYREGGNNATVEKSPGLTKFSDVTLERGQIIASNKGEFDLLRWYNQVFDVSSKRGSPGVFRRTVDVVQFNKEGREVKRWRLANAWPKTHSPVPDLDALSSANSIEKIVIVYEGHGLKTSASV